MIDRFRQRAPIVCAAAALAAAAVLACAGDAPAARETVVYSADDVEAPELAARLRSGQLVVSEQGTAMSLLFALAAAKFAPFVHSGVVSVENGHAYVYEAVGKVRAILGDNPMDSIRGRIRRRKLTEYVERQKYVEIYEPPPGTDPEAIAAYARRAYADKVPFDAYFDSEDRSAFYCTEFLAAAIEASGGATVAQIPYRDNPSFHLVFSWLEIRAPGAYLAGSFAVPERFVAAFSNGVTLRTARVHAAVNREIHRRFTSEQKLGNVFVWSGRTPQLRPDVRAFRSASFDLFPDASSPPGQGEADRAVMSLAERMFGPVKGESSHAVQAPQP